MSLDFDAQSTGWIIFSALAAAALTVLIYRHTTRLLPGRAGWSLVLLRLCSVFLLFFLLCEPATRLVAGRSEPAHVALFVDVSSSMGLSDRLGNRQEAINRFLTGETVQSLQKRYRLETYGFAETIAPLATPLPDSIAPLNAATDIGGALDLAKSRSLTDRLAGVILLTDGNTTVGRDPLRVAASLEIPVFTIGIGDTLELRDIALTDHRANDIAYVDSRIPVEATLRSQGT
ncbi:MAG: VWA domain-containing protein, partial [candidate division Zixibacteria bacterium]|nr:VWA domain-containing protein [candidate division Zixibacteria bacterium]